MTGASPPLEEGWYLMSDAELERELARWRSADAVASAGSGTLHLTVEEALAYRNAGNVPDDAGRSLRLVLHIREASDLASLDQKRLLYEPDFHDAPDWVRDGSRRVNVVPLRLGEVERPTPGAWWEEPELAPLEAEWRKHGTIAGIAVPAAYRSFVFKTVLSLRAAGRGVTADSVADSIQRWVSREDAARIRAALTDVPRDDI